MDKTFRPSVLALRALFAALVTLTGSALHATAAEAPSEQQLIETLRTGQPAEKAHACQQLAIYGSQAAVPELAKLLADEKLASWSRIALEAIPDPAAEEALIKAAKSLNGRLLVGTINSIGVRRSAAAVDQLTARLNDDDAEIASAAAVALGRIGNEPATKALRESLADAAPAVLSAIAEGCVLCAEQLMAAGRQDTAAEIYDEIRRADVPKQRIVEATRGAILARGQRGIPLLIQQLQSPDKELYQIGLMTARELPGSEVSEALAAQLDGAPPERAALIVLAIGDRSDETLPNAVVRAVQSGERPVRLAAINVIGRRGNAANIPALLEVAVESDQQLSSAAKAALAELPGDDVNEQIVSRITSAGDETLPILIELAGRRRIDAANSQLVKATEHSSERVRRAALTALGATARAKELPVLINAVVDSDDSAMARVAVSALQTASVRMPDREATAAALTEALEKSSTGTQSRLLQILGAMGGPTALETIANAAQSDDRQLQDAGTRVLGEWMTADAAPHLYEIASSDNPFKTRALRGYLRIARQLDIPDAQRLEMCRKALAIAERSAERSLALEAMKRCPSAESVQLATSLVDDAEVRDRAVETAIFIGERIKETDPEAAAQAGQKVLEAQPPRELAERARALTKIPNRSN